MNKQSFDELLAAAREATLGDNLVCAEYERGFLVQDREDLNVISVSMSWREQLIAAMEDIIEAKERAAKRKASA